MIKTVRAVLQWMRQRALASQSEQQAENDAIPNGHVLSLARGRSAPLYDGYTICHKAESASRLLTYSLLLGGLVCFPSSAC